MEQPGGRRPAPPGLRVCQDLANTVDLERGLDRLDDVAGLVAFAAEHQLSMPTSTPVPADLARVVVVREALRDICGVHAGSDESRDAAAALTAALAPASLGVIIRADGAAALRPSPDDGVIAALFARLAAEIAVAAVDGTWDRLKACSADVCRWVYYDWSPTGRSRWCTMRICGSRQKMRTYRSRPATTN